MNNFGIGLEGTGTDNNVVEKNTVFGNSNGLYLTATVQGNIIRGNSFLGNPPVQVSEDNPSSSGFDIKNLADPAANAFEGNVCVTSMNAPCAALGPSLSADPNPIPVTGNAIVGQTTISWSAPDAQVIEIHVGSPNGTLLATYGNRGSIQTGLWVSDGLTFYLQDVTGGKPLTSDYTLATLVVHLQRSSATNLPFSSGPRPWTLGASAILLCCLLGGIGLMRSGRRARLAMGALLLAFACGGAPTALGADKLDQMIASGTSPKELAQYVFDTHGCKSCHTIGHDGKLGFTANGKDRAQGFEGCIRMLTAMTVIVQLPEAKRSLQQRQKAEHFEEFGCTACHKLTPGKLGLTEVGAKLAQLHLGCVDVEKLVASDSARPQ